MFTGIIEEIGQVKKMDKGAKSIALTVSANNVLENTKIGDSIATNGICLTVTNLTQEDFTVDIMYETLNRTNMHTLHVGSQVNLERALTLNTRLGGHMVSGHIDGTGTILSITKESIAHIYTIKTHPSILKYIIEKGSVALDGISLTVIAINHDNFQVSIIPHTKAETTLFSKKIGESLNIECDLIGKYVEKLLKFQIHDEGITENSLKKYGF